MLHPDFDFVKCFLSQFDGERLFDRDRGDVNHLINGFCAESNTGFIGGDPRAQFCVVFED